MVDDKTQTSWNTAKEGRPGQPDRGSWVLVLGCAARVAKVLYMLQMQCRPRLRYDGRTGD